MEQNREPRNKPIHIYSITLWERSQEYTMEKDNLFNTWCWENQTATCKGMKLDHYLLLHTKISQNGLKTWNHEASRRKHK